MVYSQLFTTSFLSAAVLFSSLFSSQVLATAIPNLEIPSRFITITEPLDPHDGSSRPPPKGADLMKAAKLKYKSIFSSNIHTSATVNGTVTATPTDYDTEYLIPVTVGGGTTKVTANLNTNGGDLSVYAPKLGAAGSTITTSVTIGGVTVSRQPMSLNNDASGGSNEVGMLYTGNTFYVNAVSQGDIAPVFTADLKKGVPGTYGLGYIDSKAYSGSITYTTVNTAQGLWEFSANGYAIGSGGSFVSSTIDAICDTGTTLLLLPQSLVSAYYKQVKGARLDNSQGGWTFPCSATLPDLALGIEKYKATVPGSYLNYAPTSSGGSTCFGGLQSDAGIGFSIFGLTFIKSQFVVFKGTTSPSLGFAKKA